MTEKELIEALCAQLGSGRLDNGFLLPALKELGEKSPSRPSSSDLLEELSRRPGPAFTSLANHLRSRRRVEAARCLQRKKAGAPLDEFRALLGDLPLNVPPGWLDVTAAVKGIRAGLEGAAFPGAGRVIEPVDLIEALAMSAPELLPALGQIRQALNSSAARQRAQAADYLAGGSGLFPFDLPEEEAEAALEAAFAAAVTPDGRRRVLDAACSWPTSWMAGLLRNLGRSPELAERASLLLTLRFDEPSIQDWAGWDAWLARVVEADEAALGVYRALAAEAPAKLLLLWARARADVPANAREALEKHCGLAPAPRPAAPTPVEAPKAAPAGPLKTAPSVKAPVKPVAPVAPPVPEGPSLWDEHLLPFFSGNWPMLAGIAMVVVGSSLLAYYTWDKHWFVRYTVLPVLLAAFTSALARIGGWIEKRDAALKGTADMLRGASVALLPANFMAVALLARDPQVTHKEILLPVFALLYMAAAGRGLRRWCSAVYEPLGASLAPALLALNALVLLGPFVLTYAPQSGLWFLVGAGFHAGFALMAWTVARFVREQLTPKLAEEGRVPWFFGISLATTYVQVFLWVHGYLRHLPPAHAYACLVVVAGGLVLYAEQSASGRKEGDKNYGKESFIGYAAILLGLFMGAAHPEVRSLSLLLAGAVWLGQASFRRDLLHAWIAFTLLALAGGSAGLWEGFPRVHLPVLTWLLAGMMGAFGRIAKRWWDEFEGVGARMQAAVLNVTAALTVLTQWHYRSDPREAAAVLLATAALFAWRAHRDQKLVYVHTAMTVLAVSLPYLGFADVMGRTVQGNTVVFGLSMLSLFWLGLQAARPTPMIRGGRSTVLLIYGALAMTAMFLRIAFEQGRPDSLLVGQAAMSMAGPLLMAAVLACAAYWSRSLLPMGMASLMVIILLPQLRREITEHLPFIEWGSGLMSALVAAALTWLSFSLRESPALANLDEGDRFGGYAPFPLQQRDHRLFTWPVMASALFLLIKVCTWNFAGHLFGDGVHIKTAVALMVAGVAWTLRAIYYREKPGIQGYVHFGWISLVAGVWFGYHDKISDPKWHDALLICLAVLNAVYLGWRRLEISRPWAGDLLAKPIRSVLKTFSVVVPLALLAALFAGGEVNPLAPLIVFSIIQLSWFALTDGDATFGTLIFFQIGMTVLAWAAPGSGPLLERLSVSLCVKPLLFYLLALQALQLSLEFSPKSVEKIRSLVNPLFFWCALSAFILGLCGVLDGVVARELTYRQSALLLALVLGAARAQSCGPLALLALLLAGLEFYFPDLAALPGGQARVDFLTSPWRLSAFSLVMAAAAASGAWARARFAMLMEGSLGDGFFRLASRPWVFIPAMLFASAAVLFHGSDHSLRIAAQQLWTPYLAAATFAVVGASWRRVEPFAVAALLLGLGNVHMVRFHLGALLRARGLTENHLFCLGAIATLGQFRLGRLFAATEEIAVFLNRAGLFAAGFVLALLTSTYFFHPDLEAMSDWRFLLSGVMAYLAGRAFQRAARAPDAGEAPYAALFEGIYHYGVTTSLWCFALLIPWFRNPYAAFPALGLPVLYFYARAELALGAGESAVARYRNTATTLAFFLFALYAFRGAFQMVLFPQAALGVEHYHFNSPFVMILALVMFRLQGLGGTKWLGFYGGLAMMLGSYFLLTRLPGLSPFDYPIPSAWCAFGLGHFWMLFSAHASPPRTFLQKIGGVDDAQWEAHRGSWGVFLLAATQANLWWALSDSGSNTYLVAPLFLGGASLLAHQARIRGSVPLYVCAAFEALIAVHADFFTPSWLAKDDVVWVVIGLWAAILSTAETRPDSGIRRGIGAISLGLGAVALGHVLYHHPSSTIGLWAFAATALLAALTPRPSRTAQSQLESLSAGILLVVPVWLVHFSQAKAAAPWPWLTTTAALLATGQFARWVQHSFHAGYSARERNPPRLFDQTLAALGTEGYGLNTAALYLVFGLTAWVQCAHYGRAFLYRELALMLGLYGVSAYAWFEEGRLRQSMPPYFFLQFCVIGFFAVIRRQLMLTLGWWNYEYDVWASLLVSFSLAGAKQILPIGPPQSRIPLLGTLLAMPVAVMTWVLIHGLGTDTVLLVVGLYSLMFAYMGKDDRESPYHVVAMGGFVAFVLIVFWTKLELRALSAYVIPVGLGTLTLLQMFRDKISPVIRNEIRAVVLLAMLGSAGYYALMDDRYPLYFHMTMLFVAVLAMGVGSLFRTRVYVLLGFAGLMTDLAALVYKLLVHMDRGSRMTLIGIQVLIFGAVLIGGAIYYKTNQEKFNELFARWRGRLTEWE